MPLASLKIAKQDTKIKLIFPLLAIFFLFLSLWNAQEKLLLIYKNNQSPFLKDRKGQAIAILPNPKGYYAYYINLNQVPSRFKNLLIKKEDKFFYYHFGFNPFSIGKAILGRMKIGKRKASSTIEQQLVKILLGKERKRNIKNKIIESFYVFSLEIFQPKEKILEMYINSVYFGNQAQGLYEASQLYFNLPPTLLSDGQILQILSTISSPSKNNPAKPSNIKLAKGLAKELKIKEPKFLEPKEVKINIKHRRHLEDSFFEISSFLKNNNFKNCSLTIDNDLNRQIRKIVKRDIEILEEKGAKNAALVVIKLPENEILSLIGSPNPNSLEEGYQINMLLKPRAIGSTIKPFIYLKGFEKGLRPYTLVDDREYKYLTGIGFPLYPKNFDYKYRGIVSCHYALSNSLNVPALKVLEYVGIEDFYKFIKEDLEFKPIQSLENYQLGIALGGLEMNLLNLARYFTIFPNNGILKPLKISNDKTCNSYFADQKTKKISEVKYIQLVNKILSDRKAGIEEFGLKSEFNLFQKNYALKTGTSRDFKDSWIVGYTPDFLVAVWVGNANLSPTKGLSGQIGAGKIWQDVMELLLNSRYNKKTPFSFNLIKTFKDGRNLEYGLEGDNYQKIKNILIKKDDSLILTPHQNDIFLLKETNGIILQAKEEVNWFINERFFKKGEKIVFKPLKNGEYKITAKSKSASQDIIIRLK